MYCIVSLAWSFQQRLQSLNSVDSPGLEPEFDFDHLVSWSNSSMFPSEYAVRGQALVL